MFSICIFMKIKDCEGDCLTFKQIQLPGTGFRHLLKKTSKLLKRVKALKVS